MPKVSRASAAHVDDHGPVVDRYEDVQGYTISFVQFREATDGTPLLRGLPGDQCHCPHWGYVLRGRLVFRTAEGDESIEPGEAFYVPPGHVPLTDADTEIVMFSPSEELAATSEAMAANLRALQGA